MVDSKMRNIAAAAVLILTLITSQLYMPVSSAQTASQPLAAVLTTANNQPVTVNGASTIGGASVFSGATIETPDQVGASLSVPGHFTLDMSPNASVSVTFDKNGIKVNLIKGCVVLHVQKGTTGEIVTSHGTIEKADGSKDARLDVCDKAPAPAGGLGTSGTIAIIGAVIGALALIPLLGGGSNPSPRNP